MAQFKTPKGTRDFLPEEMEKRTFVEGIIRDTFESYGFQLIQTPIFEEFDLLSARSGEEIREKMFTFVIDDKEYALRPEMTAPVCRLVGSEEFSKRRMPKPYKFYYIGPCYRYERPQAGRYREFWQAGIELMGSSSSMADAEVITVAVRVLERLGISAYNLKVGHIGIFRDILAGEGYDFNFQNKIISDMDAMMSIKEKCETILKKTSFDRDDFDYVKTKISDLYTIQEEIQYEGEYEIVPEKDFNEDTLREWLTNLPSYAEATYRAIWITRDNIPEDLVNLLINISRIKGKETDVIKEADTLLSRTPANKAFKELLEVLRWLKSFGVQNYDVVLGIARGLDFYTGTVFEIDCPLLGAQKQICGGGRYDKLVSEFGGPQIPATGFAFGFDRVVEAFEKSGLTTPTKRGGVFVATTSTDLRFKAVEIAERLRKEGKKAEVDLMGRDLKGQLGYASSKNYDYSIIVAPKELEQESVVLRNMKSGEERVVRISSLSEEI